jgi:hypothetical protein
VSNIDSKQASNAQKKSSCAIRLLRIVKVPSTFSTTSTRCRHQLGLRRLLQIASRYSGSNQYGGVVVVGMLADEVDHLAIAVGGLSGVAARLVHHSEVVPAEPRVTLHRSLAFSNGRTTFSPAC